MVFYIFLLIVWIATAIFTTFQWYWILGLYVLIAYTGWRMRLEFIKVLVISTIAVGGAILILQFTDSWWGGVTYGFALLGMLIAFSRKVGKKYFLAPVIGLVVYFTVGHTIQWIGRPIKDVRSVEEACSTTGAAGIVLTGHKSVFEQTVGSEVKSVATGGRTPSSVTQARYVSPVVPSGVDKLKPGESACLWLMCESSSKTSCWNSFEKWNGHGLFAKKDVIYNMEGLKNLGQKFSLIVPENAKVLIVGDDAYAMRTRWLTIALWFASPLVLFMGIVSSRDVTNAKVNGESKGSDNQSPNDDFRDKNEREQKPSKGITMTDENGKSLSKREQKRSQNKSQDGNLTDGPVSVTRGPNKAAIKGEFRKAMDDLFAAAKIYSDGREQPTGVYTASFPRPVELTNEWIDFLRGLEHFRSIELDGKTLMGIDFDWTEYRVEEKFRKD
ncbi:MAG: hypothetical protein NT027_11575 [Proteobacteria bacterium]|nr:hypothetical protein [Pseudomonadota bacterium]